MAEIFDPFKAAPESTGIADPFAPGYKPPTLASEFGKGVSSGIDALQGAGYGLVGLAGDALGAEGVKKWGLEGFQRNQVEQQANAPAIGRFEDIGSLKDAGLYVAGGLGQLAPFAASSIVTGGIGGLAGRALGQGAARAAGERLLAEKAGEVAAGNLTRESAIKAAQEAAGSALTRSATRGAIGGAAAGSVGTEQGLIYGDIYDQTGQTAPGTAALYGLGAGLLDVLPEAGIISRLAGKQATKGLVREIAGQAGKEAATEAAQTVVERGAVAKVDPTKEVFSPEGVSEIANAAVLGGLGGGVAGAGGKLLAGAAKQQGNLPADQPIPVDATVEAPQAASAAPVIDPNAGPLSRAAHVAVSNGTAASPAPAGSFGQMDELAGLIGQEQADVAGRRAAVAQGQVAEREARLQDINAAVEGNREQQSIQARRSVLDAVLADPGIQNPLQRFQAELKRQGFGVTAPTQEERQTVARFQQTKEAFGQPDELMALVDQERADVRTRREAAPVVPNELDAAALGIRQRATQPAAAGASPARLFPIASEKAATARAREWSKTKGQGYVAIQHPSVDGAFAVVTNKQAREMAQAAAAPPTAGEQPNGPVLGRTDAPVAAEVAPQGGVDLRGGPGNAPADVAGQQRGGIDAGGTAPGMRPDLAAGTAVAGPGVEQQEASGGPPMTAAQAEGAPNAAEIEGSGKIPLEQQPQGGPGVREQNQQGAKGQAAGEGQTQAQEVGGQQLPAMGGVQESMPATVRPARGGRANISPEDTQRLTRVTDHADDLRNMAQDAGWAEQGGRLLRDTNGEVTGRTAWRAHADWFHAGMLARPEEVRSAVDKAAAGKPLSAKERRTVAGMVEWLEAQKQGRPLDENSSAYDFEHVGYNEASSDERAALDAAEEFMSETTLTEAEAMRALGFSEEEISEALGDNEAQGSQAGPGETQPRGPPEGGEHAGAPFQLAGQTREELRSRDESLAAQQQREAEAQRQADEKAQADRERDSFTLTGSTRPADVAASQGQSGLLEQPAQPAMPDQTQANAKAKSEFDAAMKAAEVSAAQERAKAEGEKRPAAEQPAPKGEVPGKNAPLEDFGEKLGGARKDMAAAMRKEWTDEELASQPLSKIWPANEIDGIENKFAAAVAHAARAEIPSKPRVSYKVNRWVEKVKTLRGLAGKIVGVGEDVARQKLAELSSSMDDFRSKVALLEAIDRDQWSRIGPVSEHPTAYRWGDNGEKILAPSVLVEIDGKTRRFEGAKSIADALEQMNAALGVGPKVKPMQFDVRGREGAVFINKKGDSEYRRLKEFKTSKEAFDFIKSNHADLVAAWDAVKASDNVTKADVRGTENLPRAGQDYRNGEDVTPQRFETTFGFRGTEFGKWIKQGLGAKERQGFLNQVYDAFMDLATIVGVPPKALSLNGTLGLGFGSRGSGSASAHFEPGNLVINLTKTRGAGALAHEWFHALDNYFSRQRGGEIQIKRGMNAQDAYREQNFITYRPEPMYVHKSGRSSMTAADLARNRKLNPNSAFFNTENWSVDPAHPQGVRPEVEQAFAKLVEVLNESPMAARARMIDKSPNGYWSRIIERGARSFENYVISKMMEKGYRNDYLANVREVQDFPRSKERYPYLLPEEVKPISEAFDNLFGTIQTKETERGTTMFSFAGRKARTADTYALASAQERLAAGEDAETVRQETGWHRGADGLMRFEINDRDASLRSGPETSTNPDHFIDWIDEAQGRENGVPLGQVLDHPALFAAYPQLAAVRVKVNPEWTTVKANYSHDKTGQGTITVPDPFNLPGNGSDAVLSAMLHEAQHAIQRQEGFATGTNLKDAGGLENYRRSAGEVEARNVQTRQRMTDAERRGLAPNWTTDVADQDVIASWNGKEMASEPANAAGGVEYSRGAGRGMALRDLRAVVDRVSAQFKNLPRVHVLDSPSELSTKDADQKALRDHIRNADAWYDVEGATHNGEIYLFASGIRNEERAEHVLATHEITHYGLRGVMGGDLDAALNRVWYANAEIRKAAAERRKSFGLSSNVEAVEEVLADMPAESLAKLQGWRGVVKAVRDWLQRNGFEKLAAKLDGFMKAGLDGQRKADLFVSDLVTAAREWVKNGRGGSRVMGGTALSNGAIHPGAVTRAVRVIRTVLEKWKAGDYSGRAENFMPVGSKIVEAAKVAGISIDGYSHAIDQSAIQHVKKQHGDATKEEARGQIAISEADYNSVPEVVSAPDYMVFGVKNRIGKEIIGYVKQLADGRFLYIEEIRSGRNQLALDSMRRYPGGRNAISVAETLGPDVQNGSGDVITLIDMATGRKSSLTAAEIRSGKSYPTMLSRGGANDTGTRFSRAMSATLKGGPEIVGAGRADYTQAQRDFFDRTGRTIHKPSIQERLQALWKDAGKKLAQGLVDQFAPIKDLSGKAYMLARLSKGASGAFEALLHHGKLSIRDGVFDADQSGGVIERLFAPLQGEGEDFLWWVAANRAERLSKEDREHLFTPEDIAAGKSLADGKLGFDYTLQHGIPGAPKGTVTRSRKAAYQDSLRTFEEFNRNAMDMAEQSGLIDGAARKLWEHEFYVPFYRVSDEEGFRGVNIKSALVRQEAFKALKGGADKLNSDLLANTLQNWAHLIDASAKNRAAMATLQAAEKMGAARKAMPGEKQTVWHMDGGQKVEYKVDDPYLMTAISSLEYAGLRGPVMDAMSAFKHALTIGVTASPFFKIRNLIRDSVSAIGVAELGYNPIENIRQGIKASDRSSQTHVSMLASGGLIRFGTMLEGTESARVRQLVKKGVEHSTILDSESKVRQMYDKYLEPAIAAYNELGNRGEEINRAALYQQLIAKGMDHATASFLARDMMDFSMQGAWASVRLLTQVVPFMNARLQGLYKLGRAAKEDPRRFAAVLGSVALASVALMLAYQDDDDWKQREDWDRDNYWWFKLGGTAFRIPKPFEIGAIGTLAERGIEYFASDEMTGERFTKRFLAILGDNLSMNPVPQLFKPIIDVYANKDSFSGRPIETMGMERIKSEYRYTANTSLAARAASTAGNAVTGMVGKEFLSPVQIDQMIRGYFGWLGSFVVGSADRMVRPLTSEPTSPEVDYWKTATGGLVSSLEGAPSRYVTQIYDQAKVVEEAYGTYRQLLRDGRAEEAQEFAEDNAELIRQRPGLEHSKKAITDMNAQIRRIERGDDSASEKRERINTLRQRQDQFARSRQAARLSDTTVED